MDVSIICVNWNSVAYLRESLASIYRWTKDLAFEVIVVDNASPAGDVDTLKQHFSDIRIIKSPTNLGFAGANNLGFRHSSGDCVLFLNPDTKLVSPAINILMQQLYLLPDVGVVGCKLLNRDLSVQTSSILKFPGILNTVFEIEYLRIRWPNLWGVGPLFKEHCTAAPVEAVSGACMLMKRNAFEKVAMFSTDYFMYSEDVDLCYKLAQAGLRNYFLGQVSIIHYGGTSSAPKWQTIMKTRAELKFCEKTRGSAYSLLFRSALALNAVGRLIVIIAARCFIKRTDQKQRWDSASTRWTTTLKTVLTYWSPDASNLPASF